MASRMLLRKALRGRASLTNLSSRPIFNDMQVMTMATVVKEINETNTYANVKNYEDIPGPSGLNSILRFFYKILNYQKIHLLTEKDYEEYGKTYRSDVPGTHRTVITCDLEMVRHIFRNAGQFPKRAHMTPWLLYREDRGEADGVLTVEGSDWHRMRTAMSKQILRPQIIQNFDSQLNDVITDMVNRIRHIRQTNGHVKSFPNEAYKWSMESVGTILFEKRMGCLQEPIPEKSQEFITAIGKMFMMNVFVFIMPELQRKWNTPAWKKFYVHWDTIFNFARTHIDEKVKQVVDASPDQTQNSFLAHLIQNPKLTQREVYSNITELLLAGVDTTSNTLCFAVYSLAANQQVQEKLRDSVQEVTKGSIPTASHLSKLSYLKAVVKETLRLYPNVVHVPRVALTDLVFAGYHIPKGTVIAADVYYMGRDANIFESPLSFKPERWLRSAENASIEPFSSLPFGFGVRSCVGRRIAELELHLMIARLVQKFSLRLHGNGELVPKFRALLTPGSDIPVEFHDVVLK